MLLKSIITAFFLILFTPYHLEAQANYKSGRVVNEQGDTLKGYINDREWIQNPGRISFKETIDKSSEEKEFDVSNSSFFQIEEEDAYQRFTLPISMDKIEIPNLSLGPDTTKQIKTVFLKLLVDGCNVNLYSYNDGIKTRYFYWDISTEIPVELGYKVFLGTSLNDNYKIVTRKPYLNQLSYLTYHFGHDTKELKRKIESAQYFAGDLSDIIVLINGGDAVNMCVTNISNDKIRIIPMLTIIARRSIIATLEVYDDGEIFEEMEPKPSFLPALGLGFYLAQKSGSRLSLHEELVLSADKLVSDYLISTNRLYEYYKYTFSRWNLTLNNILRYNVYHSGNFKGYLGSGISLYYYKIFEQDFTCKSRSLGIETISKRPTILPSEQFWFAIPLEAGVLIKSRIDIHYTYQFGLPTGWNQGYKLNINSMELGISYIFKK